MLTKWRMQIVLMAVIAITLFIIFTWKFHEPSLANSPHSQQLSNGQVGGTEKHTTTPLTSDPSKSEEKILDQVISLTEPALKGAAIVGKSAEGQIASPNLLGESLRKLLSSNKLTNFDYAWRRLQGRCSQPDTQMSNRSATLTRLTANMEAQQKPSTGDPHFILFGNASYEKRVIAIDKLNELCNKSTEGSLLSNMEDEKIRASPEFARYRDIAMTFPKTKTTLDLNNVQIKGALETVVTSPMYSTLEWILFTQLDTAPLSSAYTAEQVSNLSFLASKILVCRMGDDCGFNGFMTLEFCRYNGICGNDLESAIWDNLRARNIDTRAFRQFIDQCQQALNLLDFSILKKSK